MYPENLKYTKEHEWARVDGKIATIGITHHAQDALGDVVYVEMPKIGQELKQAGEFGVVESVKSVSTLFSPLSGKVAEINTGLADNPAAVNKSPYEDGWMIKIEIENPEEIKSLMSSEEYQKSLA